MIVWTAACTNAPAGETGADNETPPQTEEAGAVSLEQFTDDAGRTVEVPAQITRISPSGALAQMFIQALAPDLLVTIATDFAPAAEPYVDESLLRLPVVGQFYGTDNLNLEEIANIGPEIVIDVGEAKASIVEDMDNITAAIAVPAVHISATLESTGAAFRKLGVLLNRVEDAEKIAAFCDEVYAGTEAIMNEVGDDRPSVLYLLGDAGLNVIVSSSFHAEVIDKTANNVAVADVPSSKGTGNEVDLEQLLVWNPDVILFGPDSIYDTVAADPVWQEMKAIQTGSYYKIPFGPYNWMGMPPSVNRYLGMLWVVKLLYPDYADYDLYDKTAEYYRLFYHCELTREMYDAIVADSLPVDSLPAD
jgi:iron complex transport system substrate-binding protein